MERLIQNLSMYFVQIEYDHHMNLDGSDLGVNGYQKLSEAPQVLIEVGKYLFQLAN